MLTLIITNLHFPNNGIIDNPITVGLYIKGYYQTDSAYVLIEDNVPINIDGSVNASPLPSTSIDPSQKYVLKAVNELCSFEYVQPVIIYPYCPIGYTISDDLSVCTKESVVPATPPTSSENTVSESDANYSVDGTWIYNSGYAVNGTGTSTQISMANSFWINDPDNTTNGPLNRTGLWATTTLSNQTVGFSVCITVPVDSIYYVGLGCDNYAIVNIDGNNIITQDPVALAAQYNSLYPGIGAFVTFRIWHVYPVMLTAGSHVLNLIGFNVSGVATLGAEVYDLTSAEIQAATSYGAMGAGLIFSTKDYIGMPVQIGSGGTGYSCPAGYSLKYCDSPPSCVSILSTPVLY